MSKQIRDALAQSPDGLTAKQLALMLGAEPSAISRSLSLMPDTYIDRWEKSRSKYAGVHCLAFVPEDCPHP
jgi:hypothetical protein